MTDQPLIREKVISPNSGWGMLVLLLATLLVGPMAIAIAVSSKIGLAGLVVLIACIAILFAFIGLFGFLAVQPNDARVLLLFGKYIGTVRTSGFYWVNPFYSKKKVSLRIRNFETGSISSPEIKDVHGTLTQASTRTAGKPAKVNDRDGNPIEMSAVVVWKVVDTAEAMFEVDDYQHFVEVQSEAALRGMATRHPYDSTDDQMSLRGNTEEISAQLRDDIQERLNKAGVKTIEARISYLAYAPEIAAAMLQRQQAQAVVAARQLIVEGAVGMVDMALKHLERDKIVSMNDASRATLVSNLLVVLCSDRHTQPVVNMGS